MDMQSFYEIVGQSPELFRTAGQAILLGGATTGAVAFGRSMGKSTFKEQIRNWTNHAAGAGVAAASVASGINIVPQDLEKIVEYSTVAGSGVIAGGALNAVYRTARTQGESLFQNLRNKLRTGAGIGALTFPPAYYVLQQIAK